MQWPDKQTVVVVRHGGLDCASFAWLGRSVSATAAAAAATAAAATYLY